MSLRSAVHAGEVGVLLLAWVTCSQASDLQRHLQERYQNRIFLLRGFYANEHLRFDEAGTAQDNPTPGSWTLTGFVLVTGSSSDGKSVALKGRRMLVISRGQVLDFVADSPKKRNKSPMVAIEGTIDPRDPVESLDALMAKIFLTDRDSLLALVPSYWQTCLSAALNQVNDPKFSGCRLSAEMLSIPGMNANADMRPNTARGATDMSAAPEFVRVFRRGEGVSPPKAVFTPEPQYNRVARDLALHGLVTLGLIVDDKGSPRNIHILYPLGCGLDEEAIRAVQTWKFEPARRKGQGPVAVEIAVEVDFQH